MKFGLIGIGKWGRNYIKAIDKLTDGELICCSSRNENSYNDLPSELSGGLIWTSNTKDLFSNVLGIDTIIIATPPDTHFELAINALEAGKHVICEKPCMFNLSQFEAISSACSRNRVFFYTNYINQYISVADDMRNEIRTSDYSHLDLINIGCGPYRDYPSLWDYGSHEVFMAFYINQSFSYKIKNFYSNSERHFLSLEFPKSKTSITVGSGFPRRVNSKFLVGEYKTISFRDEKKEDLLLRMLQSFSYRPYSNLFYSESISSLINHL